MLGKANQTISHLVLKIAYYDLKHLRLLVVGMVQTFVFLSGQGLSHFINHHGTMTVLKGPNTLVYSHGYCRDKTTKANTQYSNLLSVQLCPTVSPIYYLTNITTETR